MISYKSTYVYDPPPPPPIQDPSDEEADGSDSDDDGGYYIMFRKPDELMPPSCLFDQLERADADRSVTSSPQEV